nr:immunoglobulin light chain junction region [Macaca mulatta]
CMQGLEFLLTF